MKKLLLLMALGLSACVPIQIHEGGSAYDEIEEACAADQNALPNDQCQYYPAR